jgi:lipooligosaccharide transport system ATP-binding protein
MAQLENQLLTPQPPAQDEREAIIVARNLQKRYKDFEAVKGIDFTVYQQECFGILGPNGAGKSTTIRMLHCFSPITAGLLTVLGQPVTGNIRKIKSQLGVVSQDDNLDPDLNVIQNLLVYARYFGLDKAEAQRRAQEALELFQLWEKRNNQVDELSGGMKRRLVIARSLINRPRLIILDEPTTGLDPAARQLVWQKLRYLRDSGVTLVLTTHYMEEAMQLCDRLVIMNEGKILAEGTPLNLVRELVGYEVIELRTEDNQPLDLDRVLGERPVRYEQAGDTYYLFGTTPTAFHHLELPEIVSYELRRHATLEDVFLRLTGRGLNEGGEE